MSKIGNSLLSLYANPPGLVAANRFVGFDDAQASVQGQKVKGVSEYSAGAAGQAVAVTSKGTAVIETGGAFNPGDQIISDNQGRGIVTTLATDYVKGEALFVSTGAGLFIEILLK